MTKQMAALFIVMLSLTGAPAPSQAATAKTLKPFSSDAQFARHLARWKHKAETRRQAENMPLPAPPPMQAAAPAGAAMSMKMSAPVTAAAKPTADASITNVQTQGVDEGDIVKQHGDYLVVLRRGRLFTVRIGGDALEPVSALNAYAPDADPAGTWYDEMLIADGTVVVIGYSYARGGTEIGLFDLDAHGAIKYRATYQMRSSDYYSSRNYASRLIGHQLIFYSPLPLDASAADPFATFPALRRWHAGATPEDFQRILPANRIYRSGADIDVNESVQLHTVSICDLDAAVMQCRSSAVLGPAGRVFYVSNDAVYIWTSSWHDKTAGNSALFRLPLNGSAPSGIRTSGAPIDQMSFLERDGYLNVLVGTQGNGESMWAANGTAGQMALMRLPLTDLGDGSAIAPRSDYRALPDATGNQYALQNRYIGDWLVFGSASSNVAHALQYAAWGAVADLQLEHPVVRIEAMGSDAILVGSKGEDLHFTSVALGRDASVAGTFVQAHATQYDERTHGFFYKAQGADSGIVGLPIVRADDAAAAVLYLHNVALRLSRLGALDSHVSAHVDDACKASCVDWYGNARPIFVGARVFALLGYELVEGRIAADAIDERRRTNFAPAIAVAR